MTEPVLTEHQAEALDNIASDIADIKLSAESLDRFFTGLSDVYPNLYDNLRALLRNEGKEKSDDLRVLLRDQTKGITEVVGRATVPFGWLFICNLTLLALILGCFLGGVSIKIYFE